MRYSIPDKILKQLWENDDFFNAACKNSGVSTNRFPKNDQWIEDDGFHLLFALAGYGPSDISIEVTFNSLIISSAGIGDTSPECPVISEDDDSMSEYKKKAKPAIQKGAISRGIARRSFRNGYIISSEFDCGEATSNMENGLLHIVIPKRPELASKFIEIMENI